MLFVLILLSFPFDLSFESLLPWPMLHHFLSSSVLTLSIAGFSFAKGSILDNLGTLVASPSVPQLMPSRATQDFFLLDDDNHVWVVGWVDIDFEASTSRSSSRGALSSLRPSSPHTRRYRKTKIGKRDVKVHIYEYTTQISITPYLKIETSEKGVVPVQVIFCLKEKNQKKINSTDGSSTPSVQSFKPTSASPSTLVEYQVQPQSTTSAKSST